MEIKALIYCRVSRDEQAENHSLLTQENLCRKWAEDRGYEVVEALKEDYSGASPDRPEMNIALQMASSKAYSVLLCADIDRFARSSATQFILEKEFERCGVKIEYILNRFENTPEGQLQKTILVGFAQFERDKIRMRSIRGREQRAQSGYVIPTGSASYGLDYVPIKHKGHFVINESEAYWVRRIFHWYTVDRWGQGRIAKELTKLKVPTKNDRLGGYKKAAFGTWQIGVITKIIKSRIYIGAYEYCGIAIEVPAIIDEATFNLAQEIRVKNKFQAKRNTKYEYLMRQRLRCHNDYTYTGHTTFGNKGQEHSYYRCNGKVRYLGNDCAACSVGLPVRNLDNIVWNMFKQIISNPEPIIEALKGQADETHDRAIRIRDQIAMLEHEIEKEQTKLAKLLDLHLEDKVPEALFTQKRAETDATILTYENELTALRAKQVEDPAPPSTDEFEVMCRETLKVIDHFTFEDKKRALDIFNVKAGVNMIDETLTITGFFPELCLQLQQFKVGSGVATANDWTVIIRD